MPGFLTPIPAALDADYGTEWTAFGDLLDAVERALAALPSATAWPIESNGGTVIGTVTLQDYFRKFTNFTWTLTDKSYSALNGGVGAVVSRFDTHRNWVSAAEEINAENFAKYMAHPKLRGATYLALHEVAHTTELGIRTDRFANDLFRERKGKRSEWPESPEWYYNERVANRIALTVADALGLPVLDKPYGGYTFDVLIRKMEIA